MENPGTRGSPNWPRPIAIDTLDEGSQLLVERLRSRRYDVSVWDIMGEIRVPTVMACIIRDGELARGWASHPSVRVASNMAILEASQTVASAIAAGREDLIVQARSLGRHERPRPLRGAAQAFLLDRRSPPVAARQVGGMEFNDHADEFGWIRSRLISAGLRHLIAVNLTVEGMYPASAVRVVIPGLETTNPFHIGRRGRFALIEDLA